MVNGCPPAVGRAVDGLLSQRPGGECDAAEMKTQQEDRKHPAEGLDRIVRAKIPAPGFVKNTVFHSITFYTCLRLRW